MVRRRWVPSWLAVCPVRSLKLSPSWSPMGPLGRAPSCWWGRGPLPGPAPCRPSTILTRRFGWLGCRVELARWVPSRLACCLSYCQVDVSSMTPRRASISRPRGESPTCRPSLALTPPECWLPLRPESSTRWSFLASSWLICLTRPELARPSRIAGSSCLSNSGSLRSQLEPTLSCRSACWRKPPVLSLTGSIALAVSGWSTSSPRPL